MHFEGSLCGPSGGQCLVQVERVLKNRKLGPDNDPLKFCAQLFFPKKSAETPVLIVFFDQPCFF